MSESKGKHPKPLVVPIIGGPSLIVRPFPPDKRFPIPNAYEVWQQTPDGNFMPLGTPQMSLEHGEAMLTQLVNVPDFKGKTLFLVRTERSPIMGNFNPEFLMGLTVLKPSSPGIGDPTKQS